jgi:hypothetical protein
VIIFIKFQKHKICVQSLDEEILFRSNKSFVSQRRKARKAINALNSIWWHKNITKNRKLYIYQTVIHNILVYGAEIWQMVRKYGKSLPEK